MNSKRSVSTAPWSGRLQWVVLLTLLLFLVAGCQSLREVANLRNVDFRLDRVTNARLAGIDLERIDSYRDLSGSDVARLGSALAQGDVPLSFVVHVEASNPSSNRVNARLTEMDWTVLLEDQETVSGTFDREVVLQPGEPQDIPVEVSHNLVKFFDRNLRGLVDLAAAVGGRGPAQNVKLRVRPSVNTPLGPMKYPNPIIVVNEDVGARESEQAP